MKIPAKKIVVAILFGGMILNAGFSFAQKYSPPHKIYLSDDQDTEERKREFWEKFRESVTPREKPPPSETHPREVTPREKAPPKEVHPKEVE